MPELTDNMNEKFIEIYKKIEEFANKKFNKTGKYVPMSQLTDAMLTHMPGASDFATDFELFNNLRNMMQHKESDKYFVIQPEVVALIEHVCQVLTKPISVGQFFAAKVIFVSETGTYDDVIEMVRVHHHTQFPVIRNGKLVMRKIVTAHAIAHALTVSQKPTVSEILTYSETVVRFIGASESIFTAEKILLDEMKNGHKSVILLITRVSDLKHVRPEDVIGLINVADLPQILAQK
jgi:CBS domain-containing protein